MTIIRVIKLLIVFLTLFSIAYSQQQTPFPFRSSPLIVIPPTPSRSATTFYVATTGNDANNGTSSVTAFKTLAPLNNNFLIPGDTLRIKGGDTIAGQLTTYAPNALTTESSSICVINSYGSGKGFIKALPSQTSSLYFTYGDRIRIAIRNIIFIGDFNPLTLSGTMCTAIRVAGSPISAQADSSFIRIDSCEFSNFKNAGISLNPGSFLKTGRYLITANNFHHLGIVGISASMIRHSTFQVAGNSITDIDGIDSTSEYGSNAVGFTWCSEWLIERNYVNRIGTRWENAAAGFYSNGSFNSTTRYNEIRNVKNKHGEGSGVYFDCASYNNRAFYNLTVNCNIGISFNSDHNDGSCKYGMPVGGFRDTIPAYKNEAAFNTIIGDSGSSIGISCWTPSPVTNPCRTTFLYNNFIYMKRSKDLLLDYPIDSVGSQIAGVVFNGTWDSTYIYNNLFVCADSVVALQHDFTRTNPVNTYYSDWFTRAKIDNNIFYFTNSDSSKRFAERSGIYYSSIVKWGYRYYKTPKNWADSTLQSKTGASYTYITGNPNIKRLTQDISVKVNPYKLDTLTCFQFSSGIADNTGVNYNSILSNYNDTLTVDWYGTAISNPPDIGIFIKP